MNGFTVLSQYSCGCQIRRIYPTKGEQDIIEYCSKHKAAPVLYEALKLILSLGLNPGRRWIAEQALAQAEE